MIEKGLDLRGTVEILNIEERIPREHLLRKIDSAVDFEYIYALVQEQYSQTTGRKSIDPVVIFKIVLLQHLYGIPSLRQTLRENDMNMAYRWFLGYNFSEEIPHFSTVSWNFLHRYREDIAEKVFAWSLYEVEKAGYLEPEVVFIDATHVRANANLKKQVKKAVPQAARTYGEQLRKEINADRQAHGKEPFPPDGPDDEPPMKETVTSQTDPDCGLFHKGEQQKCFAYGAHTVCDKNNFILDVEVKAGNIHDSLVFDTVYDRVTTRFPEVRIVTADAGYKTPWICKKVLDDGRIPSLPYKRPQTKKGNLPWYDYVYDEYYDCILCPEYRVLHYATTNREGYQEYKSRPYLCVSCEKRQLCTQSQVCRKTVTRHIWADYIDKAEDIRHSPAGQDSYSLRSRTIERVFADAKEKHGLRYTTYRGLAQVSSWVRLTFAAMNLKKLAICKWKQRFSSSLFALFLYTFPLFFKRVFRLWPEHPFFDRLLLRHSRRFSGFLPYQSRRR